ncbi:MAG: TolC family protein [Desulfobacteraceae bacterium]|nr:TolC family protein [Desulfobacteraceae bacterium]
MVLSTRDRLYRLIVFVFVLVPFISCADTRYRRNIESGRMENSAADPRGEAEIPMAPSPDSDTGLNAHSSPDAGPIRISVKDAGLMAFENNRSLKVERFNPEINRTFEQEEAGRFDPVLEGDLTFQRTDTRRTGASDDETIETDTTVSNISLEQFFPGGTTIAVEAEGRTTDSSIQDDPFSTARLGLTVTQALLRGFGRDVNLARLQRARLATEASVYELRGFSESLLTRVESAYWDYALAQRRIEIVEESLKLVTQQLDETLEMIRVGKMAEAELPAVQAEVALQKQGLINARSDLATTRLRLLRILNPSGPDFWNRDIELLHQARVPDTRLDNVESHVALALQKRSEINEAKLNIERNDLELVRTKNGLLPKMDVFIRMGKTGYAESFGDAVSKVSGDHYDIAAGLSVEFPVRNRGAGALHRRFRLQSEQSTEALANLVQLVELDVRTAYIEVTRTREQIAASTATRRLQEEKYRIETEKFRVGRSTNLLVAQAQRDLLVSRINEVQALINYLKALINLYRLDGSLLDRRGFMTPGASN